MKKCWKCAEEIQDAAVACRFCGANQASLDRTRMISDQIDANIDQRRRRVRFVSVVAIFIFCLWVGEKIFSGGVAPTDLQGVQMEQQPAIAVTAVELSAAYDANEVAAQEQFGNRIIEVSGKVDSITLDLTDDPVVNLSVPGTLIGVKVNFAADQNQQVATLSKGQQLTVTCSSVREFGGSPILDDCRI